MLVDIFTARVSFLRAYAVLFPRTFYASAVISSTMIEYFLCERTN